MILALFLAPMVVCTMALLMALPWLVLASWRRSEAPTEGETAYEDWASLEASLEPARPQRPVCTPTVDQAPLTLLFAVFRNVDRARSKRQTTRYPSGIPPNGNGRNGPRYPPPPGRAIGRAHRPRIEKSRSNVGK